MKIQLTKSGPIDGIAHDAGDVVDIDNVFGARLIKRGAAVAPEDDSDDDTGGNGKSDKGGSKKGSGKKSAGSKKGDKPGPQHTRDKAIAEATSFAEEHSIELPEEDLDAEDLKSFITTAMERRSEALGADAVTVDDLKAFAQTREIDLPEDLDEPALADYIWKAIDALLAADSETK